MTGAILVTYTNWRVIYGVQGGMSLVGLLLMFFFFPVDLPEPDYEIQPIESESVWKQGLHLFSPRPILMQHRNMAVSCVVSVTSHHVA